MKSFFGLLVCTLIMHFTSRSVPASSVPGYASDPVPLHGMDKKVWIKRVQDLQKLAGRRLKLKEKIALYVLKKSIRKQEPTEKNQGLIASLLGISSLAFLFLAILFAVSFVSTGLAPLILTGVGSLTTSLLGSIKAKKVLRKTPEKGEEGQRKLAVLGMITSSITIAAILIMVLIGGCVLSI